MWFSNAVLGDEQLINIIEFKLSTEPNYFTRYLKQHRSVYRAGA